MIPEGWQPVPLAAIAKSKIVYGIVQAGPHDPTGVPYLKSSDIGGQIDCSSLQRTAPEIHQRFGRSTVVPGDIVISLRGNIGDTSIVPDELVEANLTQGTARISVAEDFDRDFIFFQIASADVQRRIHSVTKGSTFVEITLEDLRKIEVPVPQCRRQQRYIADLFIDWNRAIETVEALIANARAQKQALMQQLLPQGTTPPQKRLPGFSGEWREVKLGSLADISKGEQKGRASLADEGPVPVINGGITPSGYTDNPNTAANTITISEGGNSCGHVDFITQAFWCGGHCYALKNLKVDQDYLFAVLKHRQPEIMSLRVGSGLPNIQKKALSQFSIPVPPTPAQVRIGELAASAGKEIAALGAQLTALRQEKAALMQQLLTGKRPVKLPESEAA